MSDALLTALTFVAALGSGLMAGLFFVFSVVIMKALGRLPPDVGIAAMQSINKTILNPWFLLTFFGTAAACLVSLIVSLVGWRQPGAAFGLAASLLYLVGGIVVTMVWNVPLNNALAAADAGSAEGARVWTRYLRIWAVWNHVRTVTCLAAAALFTLVSARDDRAGIEVRQVVLRSHRPRPTSGA